MCIRDRVYIYDFAESQGDGWIVDNYLSLNNLKRMNAKMTVFTVIEKRILLEAAYFISIIKLLISSLIQLRGSVKTFEEFSDSLAIERVLYDSYFV